VESPQRSEFGEGAGARRTSARGASILVGVIERVADTCILAARIHGASPTELACGACGNTAGNRQIYYGWTTEPNADRKWNQEVRCDVCGKHSLHVELHPARADRSPIHRTSRQPTTRASPTVTKKTS